MKKIITLLAILTLTFSVSNVSADTTKNEQIKDSTLESVIQLELEQLSSNQLLSDEEAVTRYLELFFLLKSSETENGLLNEQSFLKEFFVESGKEQLKEKNSIT